MSAISTLHIEVWGAKFLKNASKGLCNLLHYRLPRWQANETPFAQPDLPHQHWETVVLELWDSSTMEQVVAPRDLVELAIRDLQCPPKKQYVTKLSQHDATLVILSTSFS